MRLHNFKQDFDYSRNLIDNKLYRTDNTYTLKTQPANYVASYLVTLETLNESQDLSLVQMLNAMAVSVLVPHVINPDFYV